MLAGHRYHNAGLWFAMSMGSMNERTNGGSDKQGSRCPCIKHVHGVSDVLGLNVDPIGV